EMEQHLQMSNSNLYAVGNCCALQMHACVDGNGPARRPEPLDPVAGSLRLAAGEDARPDLDGEAALFLEDARWHTRSIKIASKPVSPVLRSASTAGTPVSA